LHGLKTKNKVIRVALVYQAAILCWLFFLAPNVFANVLDGIRVHEAPDSIRVVLDARQETQFKQFALQNPHRIVIDLKNTRPGKKLSFAKAGVGLKGIRGIRGAERGKNYRIVIDTKGPLSAKPFKLRPINPYGHRLVVDLFYPTKKKPVVVAKKNRSQEKNRDVVIAIDAGHGGEDPGALGPRKTEEKKVVLSIARRTADQINRMKGFKAVLIRTGDYYVKLEDRTTRAAQSRADMFVSIHADAFKQSSVSGASVWIRRSEGDVRESSDLEKFLVKQANQSDMIGGVGETIKLSRYITPVQEYIVENSTRFVREESRLAGEAVLRNMQKVTKLHKKEVSEARFMVLNRPDIISILVETGFISNPLEARRLSQSNHQLKLAKAIADGIGEYMRANPPPLTFLAARRSELRYTISSGDTLSEIAGRYGVSAAALKRRNKLSSDRIRVGQTIYIPRGA
jgi:N-acetylmuramoyl-L-alanine amidase